MEEENSDKVKLFGMWASPYVSWVKYALKIKGIEFEYIEENLEDKSELLLKYNPVHKKVPVLVHNGLPIVESMIILEYIDEVWADPPHLLPKVPYLRAKHRFWAAYFESVYDTIRKILVTEGEEHEKAIKNELMEKLDMIEEGMKELFPNEFPSYKDVKPGYLDIIFYSVYDSLKNFEDFFKIELVSASRYPKLVSWNEALNENSQVKDIAPPKVIMLGFLETIRKKCLMATKALD